MTTLNERTSENRTGAYGRDRFPVLQALQRWETSEGSVLARSVHRDAGSKNIQKAGPNDGTGCMTLYGEPTYRSY